MSDRLLQSAKIVIAPAWRDRLQRHGLTTVEGVYQAAGDAVTRSGSTEVRRVTVPGDNARPAVVLFIKKYWAHRAGQLWSGFFRGTFFGRSKVRQEFENLARLREWGLDAPEPIAYGEERRGRFLVRSFLISAGIEDPVALDIFIRDRLAHESGAVAGARRRQLIDALAEATRRLHAQRFVHHDYFWRNIILRGGHLDHFWLIDAHKGRLWRPGEETAARATDLASLDAPAIPYFRRTERLRFFLQYRGVKRLGHQDRALLREVLRRAAPLREKQLRRVETAGQVRGP